MTTAGFTVTVTGVYPAPPGSPQDDQLRATTSVTVPRVGAEQAPYAMLIQPTPLNGLGRQQGLRTHAGRLYTPLRVQADTTRPGSPDFPAHTTQTFVVHPDWDDNDPDPVTQHARIVGTVYGYYLIVDGVVWVEIGEPRYLVDYRTYPGAVTDPLTGGLRFELAFEDNPGVPAAQFFRADQFDQAYKYAKALADRAGDATARKYLDSNRSALDQVVVTDPSAVTLTVPAAPPLEVRRWQQEYASAVATLATTHCPTEEADAFERASSIRSRIVEAGFLPLAHSQRPAEAREAL